MDDFCGQLMPNPDKHGLISFTFDPKNITLHNCTIVMRAGWMGIGYEAKGFLLAFQEVSLFDPDCNQTSISVEQYEGNPMHGNYEYGNHLIPGRYYMNKFIFSIQELGQLAYSRPRGNTIGRGVL